MSFWDELGAIGSGITTGMNSVNDMYGKANTRQQSDIATARLQAQYDADQEWDLFNATSQANVGGLDLRSAQQEYQTQQANDAYQLISPEYRAAIAQEIESVGGSGTPEGRAAIAAYNDSLGRIEQNTQYNQTEQVRKRAEDIIISRLQNNPEFASMYAIGVHPETGGLIGFTGALDADGTSTQYVELPAQVMEDYYGLIGNMSGQNNQGQPAGKQTTGQRLSANVTQSAFASALSKTKTAMYREYMAELMKPGTTLRFAQAEAQAREKVESQNAQISEAVAQRLQQDVLQRNELLTRINSGQPMQQQPQTARVQVGGRPQTSQPQQRTGRRPGLNANAPVPRVQSVAPSAAGEVAPAYNYSENGPF